MRAAVRHVTFALILFTPACRSKTVHVSDPGLPKAVAWQAEYRHARASETTDPAGACAVYRRLGHEPDFPPRELSLLRAGGVCRDRPAEELDRARLPKYLSDLGLDLALARAHQQNDLASEMKLALEKSQRKLTPTERLRLVQLALANARRLKDAAAEAEIIKRQNQVAPRLIPAPTEKEFLGVALDYRQNREFSKAHDYFEKILNSSTSTLEDKVASLKGLRLAHKNSRQMAAHLDTCARLVNYLGAHAKTRAQRAAELDAQLFYARALWTSGNLPRARQNLAALEGRLKGKVSLAELYYLRARMAEEERDPAAVTSWLDRAANEKTNDRSLRDKIFWYGAWNERRQKHLGRAAELLTKLDADTKDDFLRNRVLFWLGQTYADSEGAARAVPVWTRLITLDPIGYYGLLARRAMHQPVSLKTSTDNPTPPAGLTVDLTLAEWLGRIDEGEILAAMLDEGARTYKLSSGQNDDGWFTLFKLYARAGLYSKLFDRIGAMTPERRQVLVEAHPDLLFPRPFFDQVELAAHQFNVPMELIYSIMRQESAFDPKARSGADAFGLLQVLPEVAETLAKPHQIPYAQMEDLFEPAVAIPIGAAHLAQLFKRYDQRFILAVASYNANETAVRSWFKNHDHHDPLSFIEEIPFEETRAYVRLVMRNFIFYRLLNESDATHPGTRAIAFPEELLKLER